METDMSIRPCPYCRSHMSLRKVSSVGEGCKRNWYYFLYCDECGYGPLHAYNSGIEAVLNWNDATRQLVSKRQHYTNAFQRRGSYS